MFFFLLFSENLKFFFHILRCFKLLFTTDDAVEKRFRIPEEQLYRSAGMKGSNGARRKCVRCIRQRGVTNYHTLRDCPYPAEAPGVLLPTASRFFQLKITLRPS